VECCPPPLFGDEAFYRKEHKELKAERGLLTANHANHANRFARFRVWSGSRFIPPLFFVIFVIFAVNSPLSRLKTANLKLKTSATIIPSMRSAAKTTRAIHRARGILKPKPGEKPFAQQWAEHKKQERKLEDARRAPLPSP